MKWRQPTSVIRYFSRRLGWLPASLPAGRPAVLAGWPAVLAGCGPIHISRDSSGGAAQDTGPLPSRCRYMTQLFAIQECSVSLGSHRVWTDLCWPSPFIRFKNWTELFYTFSTCLVWLVRRYPCSFDVDIFEGFRSGYFPDSWYGI